MPKAYGTSVNFEMETWRKGGRNGESWRKKRITVWGKYSGRDDGSYRKSQFPVTGSNSSADKLLAKLQHKGLINVTLNGHTPIHTKFVVSS